MIDVRPAHGAAAVVLIATAIATALVGSPLASALIALFGGLGAILTVLPERREPPPAPIVPTREEPPGEPPIIAAIAEPVMIVGDGRVMAANDAARRLLGPHIVGEDARVAIRHPAAAERLTSGGGGDPDGAVELTGIGGPEARWMMRTRPIDARRTLVHLVDSSARHAIERMRVDFVANASHELRTPLASIIGFVETLTDEKAGGDPPTRNRFLGVIHGEARRMERLIADLMSLSRIEADRHLPPTGSVDMQALVAELCAVIADAGGARGRDLICEPGTPLPPVPGDRAQLSQLLHNLTGNAMSYGRPGTPVRIALSRHSDSLIAVTVTDQGEGIAPEHLPRLTERFYRVDPSRSRAAGGTGLGLAIVKHIVERHRGRLSIDSEPGRGTAVTVLLPVHVIKA